MNFTYSIYLTGGWTPDRVLFGIRDSSWNLVYVDSSLSTSVGENKTYTWNGKDSSGNWLASGYYTFLFEAEKDYDAAYYKPEFVYQFVWYCATPPTTPTPVIKVDITNLQTTPYLIGSGDVVVSYTIEPSGFTADSAKLEVFDKDNTLVHSNTSIAKTGGSHTATWSGSSTSLRSVHWNKNPYTVKITVSKDTSSCSDTTSMNVIQSGAVVVAETSAKTGSPLTECMEGRTVTFSAIASGFVSTFPGNLVDFKFWFRHADGTFWSATEWSYDLVEDHIAVEDNVLDGDNDHYFDTPICVDVEDNFGHFITSNFIWIRVWELWIDYFRDAATDKEWKVCVNDSIEYSGIASPDCTNWSWDMTDGWPWDVWNPTGGNQKTGNAMVIPNSDMPSSNSKFGKAYGTIKVFCEDEEGNDHTFYSTSMNSSDFPANWGDKKAMVFFNPTATTNPDGDVPNWFYYWKDALFTYNNLTYTANLGGFFGYTGWTRHQEVGGEYHITGVETPQISDKVYTDGGWMGGEPHNPPQQNDTFYNNVWCNDGIDCFNITVLHEILHYVDFSNGLNFYDEDGDLLYDGMEDTNHNLAWDPPGEELNFNDDNTYNFSGPGADVDCEWRACRAERDNWEVLLGTINNLDWSKNGQQW